MAGKAVSYQFMDALAKSVGMDAETVKQALAEINQLQTQTQALEAAAQGKASTNHASQQPIFGTANEQMYGHVKTAHEVTNDSTDGVAVSPDAVYAYAPNRNTTPLGMVIYPSITLYIAGEKTTGGDVCAQLNGNALSVSWGNTSYGKLNLIDITIPAPYKYKAIAPFIAYTNAGVGVSIEYDPHYGIVTINKAETDFKPYDSILILLAPDNA
ncbi:MAG: WXG100 family type VII secretion target [Escherichia coli]|nr:WXG100 family type VII secretion target [Escherichia coli]